MLGIDCVLHRSGLQEVCLLPLFDTPHAPPHPVDGFSYKKGGVYAPSKDEESGERDLVPLHSTCDVERQYVLAGASHTTIEIFDLIWEDEPEEMEEERTSPLRFSSASPLGGKDEGARCTARRVRRRTPVGLLSRGHVLELGSEVLCMSALNHQSLAICTREVELLVVRYQGNLPSRNTACITEATAPLWDRQERERRKPTASGWNSVLPSNQLHWCVLYRSTQVLPPRRSLPTNLHRNSTSSASLQTGGARKEMTPTSDGTEVDEMEGPPVSTTSRAGHWGVGGKSSTTPWSMWLQSVGYSAAAGVFSSGCPHHPPNVSSATTTATHDVENHSPPPSPTMALALPSSSSSPPSSAGMDQSCFSSPLPLFHPYVSPFVIEEEERRSAKRMPLPKAGSAVPSMTANSIPHVVSPGLKSSPSSARPSLQDVRSTEEEEEEDTGNWVTTSSPFMTSESGEEEEEITMPDSSIQEEEGMEESLTPLPFPVMHSAPDGSAVYLMLFPGLCHIIRFRDPISLPFSPSPSLAVESENKETVKSKEEGNALPNHHAMGSCHLLPEPSHTCSLISAWPSSSSLPSYPHQEGNAAVEAAWRDGPANSFSLSSGASPAAVASASIKWPWDFSGIHQCWPGNDLRCGWVQQVLPFSFPSSVWHWQAPFSSPSDAFFRVGPATETAWMGRSPARVPYCMPSRANAPEVEATTLGAVGALLSSAPKHSGTLDPTQRAWMEVETDRLASCGWDGLPHWLTRGGGAPDGNTLERCSSSSVLEENESAEVFTAARHRERLSYEKTDEDHVRPVGSNSASRRKERGWQRVQQSTEEEAWNEETRSEDVARESRHPLHRAATHRLASSCVGSSSSSSLMSSTWSSPSSGTMEDVECTVTDDSFSRIATGRTLAGADASDPPFTFQEDMADGKTPEAVFSSPPNVFPKTKRPEEEEGVSEELQHERRGIPAGTVEQEGDGPPIEALALPSNSSLPPRQAQTRSVLAPPQGIELELVTVPFPFVFLPPAVSWNLGLHYHYHRSCELPPEGDGEMHAPTSAPETFRSSPPRMSPLPLFMFPKLPWASSPIRGKGFGDAPFHPQPPLTLPEGPFNAFSLVLLQATITSTFLRGTRKALREAEETKRHVADEEAAAEECALASSTPFSSAPFPLLQWTLPNEMLPFILYLHAKEKEHTKRKEGAPHEGNAAPVMEKEAHVASPLVVATSQEWEKKAVEEEDDDVWEGFRYDFQVVAYLSAPNGPSSLPRPAEHGTGFQGMTLAPKRLGEVLRRVSTTSVPAGTTSVVSSLGSSTATERQRNDNPARETAEEASLEKGSPLPHAVGADPAPLTTVVCHATAVNQLVPTAAVLYVPSFDSLASSPPPPASMLPPTERRSTDLPEAIRTSSRSLSDEWEVALSLPSLPSDAYEAWGRRMSLWLLLEDGEMAVIENPFQLSLPTTTREGANGSKGQQTRGEEEAIAVEAQASGHPVVDPSSLPCTWGGVASPFFGPTPPSNHMNDTPSCVKDASLLGWSLYRMEALGLPSRFRPSRFRAWCTPVYRKDEMGWTTAWERRFTFQTFVTHRWAVLLDGVGEVYLLDLSTATVSSTAPPSMPHPISATRQPGTGSGAMPRVAFPGPFSSEKRPGKTWRREEHTGVVQWCALHPQLYGKVGTAALPPYCSGKEEGAAGAIGAVEPGGPSSSSPPCSTVATTLEPTSRVGMENAAALTPVGSEVVEKRGNSLNVGFPTVPFASSLARAIHQWEDEVVRAERGVREEAWRGRTGPLIHVSKAVGGKLWGAFAKGTIQLLAPIFSHTRSALFQHHEMPFSIAYCSGDMQGGEADRHDPLLAHRPSMTNCSGVPHSTKERMAIEQRTSAVVSSFPPRTPIPATSTTSPPPSWRSPIRHIFPLFSYSYSSSLSRWGKFQREGCSWTMCRCGVGIAYHVQTLCVSVTTLFSTTMYLLCDVKASKEEEESMETSVWDAKKGDRDVGPTEGSTPRRTSVPSSPTGSALREEPAQGTTHTVIRGRRGGGVRPGTTPHRVPAPHTGTSCGEQARERRTTRGARQWRWTPLPPMTPCMTSIEDTMAAPTSPPADPSSSFLPETWRAGEGEGGGGEPRRKNSPSSASPHTSVAGQEHAVSLSLGYAYAAATETLAMIPVYDGRGHASWPPVLGHARPTACASPSPLRPLHQGDEEAATNRSLQHVTETSDEVSPSSAIYPTCSETSEAETGVLRDAPLSPPMCSVERSRAISLPAPWIAQCTPTDLRLLAPLESTPREVIPLRFFWDPHTSGGDVDGASTSSWGRQEQNGLQRCRTGEEDALGAVCLVWLFSPPGLSLVSLPPPLFTVVYTVSSVMVLCTFWHGGENHEEERRHHLGSGDTVDGEGEAQGGRAAPFPSAAWRTSTRCLWRWPPLHASVSGPCGSSCSVFPSLPWRPQGLTDFFSLLQGDDGEPLHSSVTTPPHDPNDSNVKYRKKVSHVLSAGEAKDKTEDNGRGHGASDEKGKGVEEEGGHRKRLYPMRRDSASYSSSFHHSSSHVLQRGEMRGEENIHHVSAQWETTEKRIFSFPAAAALPRRGTSHHQKTEEKAREEGDPLHKGGAWNSCGAPAEGTSTRNTASSGSTPFSTSPLEHGLGEEETPAQQDNGEEAASCLLFITITRWGGAVDVVVLQVENPLHTPVERCPPCTTSQTETTTRRHDRTRSLAVPIAHVVESYRLVDAAVTGVGAGAHTRRGSSASFRSSASVEGHHPSEKGPPSPSASTRSGSLSSCSSSTHREPPPCFTFSSRPVQVVPSTWHPEEEQKRSMKSKRREDDHRRRAFLRSHSDASRRTPPPRRGRASSRMVSWTVYHADHQVSWLTAYKRTGSLLSSHSSSASSFPLVDEEDHSSSFPFSITWQLSPGVRPSSYQATLQAYPAMTNNSGAPAGGGQCFHYLLSSPSPRRRRTSRPGRDPEMHVSLWEPNTNAEIPHAFHGVFSLPEGGGGLQWFGLCSIEGDEVRDSSWSDAYTPPPLHVMCDMAVTTFCNAHEKDSERHAEKKRSDYREDCPSSPWECVAMVTLPPPPSFLDRQRRRRKPSKGPKGEHPKREEERERAASTPRKVTATTTSMSPVAEEDLPCLPTGVGSPHRWQGRRKQRRTPMRTLPVVQWALCSRGAALGVSMLPLSLPMAVRGSDTRMAQKKAAKEEETIMEELLHSDSDATESEEEFLRMTKTKAGAGEEKQKRKRGKEEMEETGDAALHAARHWRSSDSLETTVHCVHEFYLFSLLSSISKRLLLRAAYQLQHKVAAEEMAREAQRRQDDGSLLVRPFSRTPWWTDTTTRKGSATADAREEKVATRPPSRREEEVLRGGVPASLLPSSTIRLASLLELPPTAVLLAVHYLPRSQLLLCVIDRGSASFPQTITTTTTTSTTRSTTPVAASHGQEDPSLFSRRTTNVHPRGDREATREAGTAFHDASTSGMEWGTLIVTLRVGQRGNGGGMQGVRLCEVLALPSDEIVVHVQPVDRPSFPFLYEEEPMDATTKRTPKPHQKKKRTQYHAYREEEWQQQANRNEDLVLIGTGPLFAPSTNTSRLYPWWTPIQDTPVEEEEEERYSNRASAVPHSIGPNGAPSLLCSSPPPHVYLLRPSPLRLVHAVGNIPGTGRWMKKEEEEEKEVEVQRGTRDALPSAAASPIPQKERTTGKGAGGVYGITDLSIALWGVLRPKATPPFPFPSASTEDATNGEEELMEEDDEEEWFLVAVICGNTLSLYRLVGEHLLWLTSEVASDMLTSVHAAYPHVMVGMGDQLLLYEVTMTVELVEENAQGKEVKPHAEEESSTDSDTQSLRDLQVDVTAPFWSIPSHNASPNVERGGGHADPTSSLRIRTAVHQEATDMEDLLPPSLTPSTEPIPDFAFLNGVVNAEPGVPLPLLVPPFYSRPPSPHPPSPRVEFRIASRAVLPARRGGAIMALRSLEGPYPPIFTIVTRRMKKKEIDRAAVLVGGGREWCRENIVREVRSSATAAAHAPTLLVAHVDTLGNLLLHAVFKACVPSPYLQRKARMGELYDATLRWVLREGCFVPSDSEEEWMTTSDDESTDSSDDESTDFTDEDTQTLELKKSEKGMRSFLCAKLVHAGRLLGAVPTQLYPWNAREDVVVRRRGRAPQGKREPHGRRKGPQEKSGSSLPSSLTSSLRVGEAAFSEMPFSKGIWCRAAYQVTAARGAGRKRRLCEVDEEDRTMSAWSTGASAFSCSTARTAGVTLPSGGVGGRNVFFHWWWSPLERRFPRKVPLWVPPYTVLPPYSTSDRTHDWMNRVKPIKNGRISRKRKTEKKWKPRKKRQGRSDCSSLSSSVSSSCLSWTTTRSVRMFSTWSTGCFIPCNDGRLFSAERYPYAWGTLLSRAEAITTARHNVDVVLERGNTPEAEGRRRTYPLWRGREERRSGGGGGGEQVKRRSTRKQEDEDDAKTSDTALVVPMEYARRATVTVDPSPYSFGPCGSRRTVGSPLCCSNGVYGSAPRFVTHLVPFDSRCGIAQLCGGSQTDALNRVMYTRKVNTVFLEVVREAFRLRRMMRSGVHDLVPCVSQRNGSCSSSFPLPSSFPLSRSPPPPITLPSLPQENVELEYNVENGGKGISTIPFWTPSFCSLQARHGIYEEEATPLDLETERTVRQKCILLQKRLYEILQDATLGNLNLAELEDILHGV